MHEFADAYVARNLRIGNTDAPTVSFTPGISDESVPTTLPSGATVRARPDEELSAACLTQANADRVGGVPLMPLMWQGDLPGIPGTGAMHVRDLGLTENAKLIARYPGRRVGVLLRHPADGSVTILPYTDAMRLLWSSPITGS
jgi:hypothetical protein